MMKLERDGKGSLLNFYMGKEGETTVVGAESVAISERETI